MSQTVLAISVPLQHIRPPPLHKDLHTAGPRPRPPVVTQAAGKQTETLNLGVDGNPNSLNRSSKEKRAL